VHFAVLSWVVYSPTVHVYGIHISIIVIRSCEFCGDVFTRVHNLTLYNHCMTLSTWKATKLMNNTACRERDMELIAPYKSTWESGQILHRDFLVIGLFLAVTKGSRDLLTKTITEFVN
ncbi:hypothetical protein L9F63_020199, partial [Diploptera punctata]